MPSKIGAVELALHTIIEATSITTCFYGTAPSVPGIDTPYAVLRIADGGPVDFDINSRNRVTWFGFLSVAAQADMTVTAGSHPFEQLYTAMEELIICFDAPANRATLMALDNSIDVRMVGSFISDDGTEGMIRLEIEMDYPYNP